MQRLIVFSTPDAQMVPAHELPRASGCTCVRGTHRGAPSVVAMKRIAPRTSVFPGMKKAPGY